MAASQTKRAQDAMRWFAEAFGLHAWEAELYWQDEPPPWILDPGQALGWAAVNKSRKYAKIWVSPARSKADESDPISTLFHELCHILAAEAGLKGDTKPRREYVWSCLGELLAGLWQK